MHNSLLQLIERTKPRIKPLFKKQTWLTIRKHTIYLASVAIIGLASYYTIPMYNSKEGMHSLMVFGTIIGSLGTFLLSLLYLCYPFEFMAFNKNQPISTSAKSEKLLKLTPAEIQELMECELNSLQNKTLTELIETRGYLTYADLLGLHKLEGELAGYLANEMDREKKREVFCKEHGIKLDKISHKNIDKEVEMEWGETKPLKNWL